MCLTSLELEGSLGQSQKVPGQCFRGIRRGVARDEENQGHSEHPMHGMEGPYFVSSTVLEAARNQPLLQQLVLLYVLKSTSSANSGSAFAN